MNILLPAPLDTPILAAAGKPPKVSVLAYSGGMMSVEGFGPVIIDLAGTSLPANVPLLLDHEQQVRAIAGSGAPAIRDGRLYVEGLLAAGTPAGDQVLALARAQVALQASVGVEPVERRRLAAGETVTANGRSHTAGPAGAWFVTKSVLREVSLVAVGADATTAVSIAARAAQQGVSKMESTTLDPAVATERERVKEIGNICTGVPDAEVLRAKAINEGWTPDTTRKAALEAIRAGRPTAPAILVGAKPGAPSKNVLAAAVLMHGGRESAAEKNYGADTAQAARELRCHSLVDLCAVALRMSGQDVPVSRTELIRAAFSSRDLPVALGDSASKLALDAYRETPATWRSIARVVSAKDFKEQKLIRLLLTAPFEAVAPGGELHHGVLEESVYTVKAGTKGQILCLTRQDVINDDLGILDLAAALGRAGMRAVSDKVYEVLLGNANNFFSEANGNYLAGAETVLGVNALEAGLSALATRTDAGGNNLDLRGRTLLVASENEVTGRELLTSQSMARYVAEGTDRQPQGNPFTGLTLAVEPRLSNTAKYATASALAWYLFAAAQDGAVVVSFLDGRDSPIIEQVQLPADVLGIGFRGYIDFGAAFGDPLAAQKMKGEA